MKVARATFEGCLDQVILVCDQDRWTLLVSLVKTKKWPSAPFWGRAIILGVLRTRFYLSFFLLISHKKHPRENNRPSAACSHEGLIRASLSFVPLWFLFRGRRPSSGPSGRVPKVLRTFGSGYKWPSAIYILQSKWSEGPFAIPQYGPKDHIATKSI